MTQRGEVLRHRWKERVVDSSFLCAVQDALLSMGTIALRLLLAKLQLTQTRLLAYQISGCPCLR